MKNVKIKLISTQTDGVDTNRDINEYMGTISSQSGVITVSYTESEDFGSLANTEIVIESDTRVLIRRTGQNNSVMLIEKGVRNTVMYQTQYGDISLRFYGKEIKNNMNINGGTLSLKYEISTDASNISNNTIELMVKEMQN